MAEVDPDTLFDWLSVGCGDEREVQLMALEQLCMLLLMSDNIDRCFESCPPRTFLPALCRIFTDQTAPPNVLEVTARAITYYLDVSAECTRRIVSVEGAIKAICDRLDVGDINDRTNKDLAEQCVKVLELMCSREAQSVYDAGGLQAMLQFVQKHGAVVHKDTLHSAMSVVTRLCSKMEPGGSGLPDCMASLSALLHNSDTTVSDSALRCFATLADHFMRRHADPAPIAQHGLIDYLLAYLRDCEGTRPSSTVSIIIGLLSSLCRGSPTITSSLLGRDDLCAVLEPVLKRDERCCLDAMRFADLLLLLMFEGRKAITRLPVTPASQSSVESASSRVSKSKEEGGRSAEQDKHHRQLIEHIRSKDTDAMISTIEAQQIDVNFTDDVGQTLLNWASAFGTHEMVLYLCQRGADANRGSRSSSLHYAACFGRPKVARTLLRYGGNTDLRDEDGKTPLDKARERFDEGHREVAALLESIHDISSCDEMSSRPEELTAKAFLDVQATGADSSSEITPVATPTQPKRLKVNSLSESIKALEQDTTVTVDPPSEADSARAAAYIKALLPVFCRIHNETLSASVRRSCLNLVRKMTHYASSEQLAAVEQHDVIIELISSVITCGTDDDATLTVLTIAKNLLAKKSDYYLEEFVRLGVANKIDTLAQSCTSHDPDASSSSHTVVAIDAEDAHELSPGYAYYWKDWSLVRSRDCLFLWCEVAAIELSSGSNGWFRYVLDGRTATMFSSGSPESNADSTDARAEFIDKLLRSRQAVKAGAMPRTVFSSPNADIRISFGNWNIASTKQGELCIRNCEGARQCTTLREDLAGFVFESNRNTRHSFSAESPLGPEFSTSFNNRRGRKVKSKHEAQKQKACVLAKEIADSYLAELHNRPSDVMVRLQSLAEGLASPFCATDDALLKNDLVKLREYLLDEKRVSTYELFTSGVLRSLVQLLEVIAQDEKKLNIFYETIAIIVDNKSPLRLLARKLISVVESAERLPLYFYDAAGGASGFGLQLLNRRFRLRMEKLAPTKSSDPSLVDLSGRLLKIEPLVTVRDLRRFLARTVAKQWYDYDRASFGFIQDILTSTAPLAFTYSHDFDEHGIIHWVGTNGRRSSEWLNPAQHSLMHVTSSEGRALSYGRLEDVLSRDANALNCHTNDDKKAYISIDTGLWIRPTMYTLRHARGYNRSALRNWLLQASKDGQDWTSLYTHTEDAALTEPGTTATWPLTVPEAEQWGQGYRYFRIQQNGKNASAQTHYLSLSGFELYGEVTGAVETLEKPKDPVEMKRAYRRSNAVLRNLRAVSGIPVSISATDAATPPAPTARRSGAGTDAATAASQNKPPVAVGNLYRVTPLEGKLDSTANSRTPTTQSNRSNMHTLGVRRPVILPSNRRGGPIGPGKRASMGGVGRGRNRAGRQPTGMDDAADGASRKSMSTTNLFEVYDQSSDRVSVASTDQAASAENLRNHTPSLENLLARARIRDGIESRSVLTESIAESRSEELATTPDAASDNPHGDDTPPLFCESMDEVNVAPPITLADTVQHEHSCWSMASLPESDVCTASEECVLVAANTARAKTAVIQRRESEPCRPVAEQGGGDKLVDTFVESITSRASKEAEVQLAARQQQTGGGDCVQSASDGKLLIPVLTAKDEPGAPKSTDEAALPLHDFDAASAVTTLEYNARNASLSADAAANVAPVSATAASSDNMAALFEQFAASLSRGADQLGLGELDVRAMGNDMAAQLMRIAFSEGSGVTPVAANNSTTTTASTNPTTTIAAAPPRGQRTLHQYLVPVTSGQSIGNSLLGSLNQTLTMMSLVSNSSDSEQDLLEATRAIVNLDDEDDMVENDDMDENEEDRDDHEDAVGIAMAREDVYEHLQHCAATRAMGGRPVPLHARPVCTRAQMHSAQGGGWEEDFVLKRQFTALIPAFDPRPGRTNVPQCVDLRLPTPEGLQSAGDQQGNVAGPVRPRHDRHSSAMAPQPIKLGLRAAIPQGEQVEMELVDDSSTVFAAIQQILHRNCPPGTDMRCEKSRRVWEPTYVASYGASDGDAAMDKSVERRVSIPGGLDGASDGDEAACSVHDVLQLLKRLKLLSETISSDELSQIELEDLSPEEFVSRKITQKLLQQLSDALVVGTGSLPSWCDYLMRNYPCLFNFDTRQTYLQATAFGVSRAIIWLQKQRDRSMESLPARHRSSAVDCHSQEFKYARLKTERVKVPREPKRDFLLWAQQVMTVHAERKAVLEVEFVGEEGTGLGPTLEFFALVSVELQRRALGIWLCDDSKRGIQKRWSIDSTEETAVSQATAGDDFVHTAFGLFPAPLPQTGPVIESAEKHFEFIGVLVAKVIQDQRLIDLPLSSQFLKLLCSAAHETEDGDGESPTTSESWTVEDSKQLSRSWYSDVLSNDDFERLYPIQAKFLKQLRILHGKKEEVEANASLTAAQRSLHLSRLRVQLENDQEVALTDMCLTFHINPSSADYGYDGVDLITGGSDAHVSLDNLERYIDLCHEYYIRAGLRRQLDAFRRGFDRVFPMQSLAQFTADEIRLILCGDQYPSWTYEDVLNYTEPRLGYTRDSETFILFAQVMAELTGEERKRFLQFTTGCSSLPPGGLASLQPRLTVVRKVDGTDGSYPSVNTCVHYLKLPEYSTAVILKERLLAATAEKGFHLN